jgi:hypothetical protein
VAAQSRPGEGSELAAEPRVARQSRRRRRRRQSERCRASSLGGRLPAFRSNRNKTTPIDRPPAPRRQTGLPRRARFARIAPARNWCNRRPAGRSERGTEADVMGAYNAVFAPLNPEPYLLMLMINSFLRGLALPCFPSVNRTRSFQFEARRRRPCRIWCRPCAGQIPSPGGRRASWPP